jgi:protein-S-isoprenylcysteine O-methyltransferase Ste14
MTPFLAKLVWWAAVIGWCAIRYPHERRARRTPVAQRTGRRRERLLLAVSLTGLFVVPATFVGTGEPRFADYPFIPALAWLGTAGLALALMLFYRTHRDLGRFWSVALEIRHSHELVTTPCCFPTGSRGLPASPASARCSRSGSGAKSA